MQLSKRVALLAIADAALVALISAAPMLQDYAQYAASAKWPTISSTPTPSVCTWCTYSELHNLSGTYWASPSVERLRDTFNMAIKSLSAELQPDSAWLSPPPDKSYFSDTRSPYARIEQYQPFVRRVIVQPNERIFVWGDLHGSLTSLVKTLKAISSNTTMYGDPCMERDTLQLHQGCRLVFLGDMVDRGPHSVEVLYAIMILRIVNGDRVIILHGNHEDMKQNNKMKGYSTTNHEIHTKYRYTGSDDIIIQAKDRFYQFLPLAVFIGVHDSASLQQQEIPFMQFTHGAVELGYTPQQLLAAPIYNAATTLHEYIARYEGAPVFSRIQQVDPALHGRLVAMFNTNPEASQWWQHTFGINEGTSYERDALEHSGYLWSDLMMDIDPNFPDLFYDSGRGAVIGKALAEALLKVASTDGTARLHGVLRGHQHNGLMMERLLNSRGFVDWYGTGNGPDVLCPEVTGQSRRDIVIGTAISAADARLTNGDGDKGFTARSFVMVQPAAQWEKWLLTHMWKKDESFVQCRFGPAAVNS